MRMATGRSLSVGVPGSPPTRRARVRARWSFGRESAKSADGMNGSGSAETAPRHVAAALLALAALVGCAARARDGGHVRVRVTHGVAAGDVSATRAHLWVRCDTPGTVHVALRGAGGGEERRFEAMASAETDDAATVIADGLRPGTECACVVCGGAPGGA